jgi:hypothetical protein
MDITLYSDPLKQFRNGLYQNFNNQADTLMELVDAIDSTPEARSIAEYSLSPHFRRSYSMLYKAVEEMKLEPLWLAQQLKPYLPRAKRWPFWLLLVDVTPNPRPYAYTLADRGMVYQPEVVKDKLPVTIGHQYSTVALGLEAEAGLSASWVLPLMSERVATNQNKEGVGMKQIGKLLADEKLPFGQELTVEVGDSSYSKPQSLYAHRNYPNVVTIARSRSNRTYRQQYVPGEEAQAESVKGHPTWYGERFSLADAKTWREPDETLTFQETSRRGKTYTVEIQAWHNLLMSGKTKPVKLPMHECPFTLVRIVRYDKDGKPAFRQPLWLIVMGERRAELTLAHIYEAYAARFNLEHFFRFGKQKLLMVAFQTPDVAREEKWFQLTHIAYAQLWMARHLVRCLPRPWERNLPAMQQRLSSPTLVQRDFDRIIHHLGTPARPPKPRNNSPGRRKGTILPKRTRHPVVVKHKIVAPTA